MPTCTRYVETQTLKGGALGQNNLLRHKQIAIARVIVAQDIGLADG
ncbi:MAG: hypothetical protein HS126_25030 [Anaerolineales bacterium]|nr:hypothetical protein [Anaerolineales bacterium]